ncbi:hypothetical protein M2283_006991 [Streptomyces pseudovenezuelae]|uniref:ThuA-like domain-containing protein n=1 Tax=Streptomyces pseudovenezuelae TaxID=67350 RepID=A0ABT6LTL0_9ACTN|nr:hypothetical protein [Streptomyces pseudovenezuelae]
MPAARTALVVRGGWEGHAPRECTELFLPALADAGFAVTVREDLEAYADADLMARTDLVVQCWSEGRLTEEQCAGLVSAVEAGTGFAGWHGGVVATFQDSPAYLRMVGGLFLHHPAEFVEYQVRIEPEQREHPIVAGLPDMTVVTEQYWMLTERSARYWRPPPSRPVPRGRANGRSACPSHGPGSGGGGASSSPPWGTGRTTCASRRYGNSPGADSSGRRGERRAEWAVSAPEASARRTGSRGARRVGLPELFAVSDPVPLHAPSVEATRGMVAASPSSPNPRSRTPPPLVGAAQRGAAGGGGAAPRSARWSTSHCPYQPDL